MKKILILGFAFTLCTITVSFLSADPGVVIDVKGKVTVNGAQVKAGAKFNDGATIYVAKGSTAQLMFSSGIIKKLNSGEKFVASGAGTSAAGSKGIIDGIQMAYNDATSTAKGPVVHGMVKVGGMGGSLAQRGDVPLDPARKNEMSADIAKINSLGLEKDGRGFMQAQVYYKYAQYQKAASALLPVYRSQNPPADMIRTLLVLCYEKMGKPAEADKYRK